MLTKRNKREVVEHLDMDIGPLIKEIRLAKNLKSNSVYSDILSRPSISRFERGESDTTTQKFFLILDRLNITLEEFYFIYYRKENDDFLIINDYIHAFYSNNNNKLDEVNRYAYNQYKITNNIRYYHYHLLSKILIDSKDDNYHHGETTKKIQDYLMNCESWGYYELVLFTNSIDAFNDEFVDVIFDKAINNLKSYRELRRYKNEIGLLVFNVLAKRIYNNNISSCNKYLSVLLNVKKLTPNDMYTQTMINFFQELIIIITKKNLTKSNIRKVNHIIEIFSFLEMEFKKNQCINLYNKVLDNNNLQK